MVHTRPTIEPKQPTVLHGENSVKLPGFELWMNYIENVFVIPTRLDAARFKVALSDTLQLYPHAAGHLIRHSEEWEIIISNTSVPLETVETESASVGIDDNWVLQRNLRQFFASRKTVAHHYESAPHGEEESRLLLFKITFATCETAIGVSWHHTLGDATVLQRFIHCLSERYQDHDVVQLPAPTFSKRSFHNPTPTLKDQYSLLMPHLTNTCPTSELGQRYASMNEDTSWVSFKICGDRLRRLKEYTMLAMEDTSAVLSAQDVLTAYIVNVLNRHLGEPITHITNAASYRNVPAVVDSPNVAGNAIYIIPTTLETASASLLDTALAIRKTISRCRTPVFVEEYMAVASALMLSAVNGDRAWLFKAEPGKLSVNSNAAYASSSWPKYDSHHMLCYYRINWRSAHFGYPHATRFHTSGLNDRYLRVFSSNPASTAANSLSDYNVTDDDSLDVFFAIARDLRDKVVETIELELQAPNFPYNIDVTSRPAGAHLVY
ncbi:hypothetical protein TRAPUB_9300 [Trametes pubescens]|uniref:Uncharacterized protein n=1 Tax=Trametes pubescens TaxID=154538 RepID=A0A1M2W2W5_TRAPU|nr:hypothetical protein TRAPUB_9300 [Trametes pubescens]